MDHRLNIAVCLALLTGGCGSTTKPESSETPAPDFLCDQRSPNRLAFYGDLHSHASFSFDALSYDTVLTPEDAYAFAQGGEVRLPPLDENGQGTRPVSIAHKLDFLAVTEHGDLLGEVKLCNDPSSDVYDVDNCAMYRSNVGSGALHFGTAMASPNPKRFSDVCGEDGSICEAAANERWQQMQLAAEEAYDRSAACSFTSFVAYEYTNTRTVSNLHRNIIFANEIVPELPVTYYEAPDPLTLWQKLAAECRDAGTGCDVLSLPHNSNLSNGNLFDPTYPGGDTEEEERANATLRAAIEPVAEVFQHKGDSECRNGFDDVDAEEDPACDFEKLRPADTEQCGDTPGTGGMRLLGCSHRHDFMRYVLKTGLLEANRLGVNPFQLGFIGSTDTHNGTPGHVNSIDFPGHVGMADDTAAKRLGPGTVTHDALIYNPGGLAAVWAEQNTREAIFEAIRRRETFATSGPRIPIRLFASWSYSDTMCEEDDMLTDAYASGVPMGSVLTSGEGAPSFLVQAKADTVPLERIQIIKGWAKNEKVFERVYDVAGELGSGTADEATCEISGGGATQLCTVWEDPDFDPSVRAFYYARALENPSCRWSTRRCLELGDKELPEGCTDPTIPKTVQQRAWSSPIWYEPN